MQVKWQQSQSGGNGARGMDPPYGGVPGLCGAPFEAYPENPINDFSAMPSPEPQEVYIQGGIMSMEIAVSANHGGMFEVSLCDSTDLSKECFDKHKLFTYVPIQLLCYLITLCMYGVRNMTNCEQG